MLGPDGKELRTFEAPAGANLRKTLQAQKLDVYEMMAKLTNCNGGWVGGWVGCRSWASRILRMYVLRRGRAQWVLTHQPTLTTANPMLLHTAQTQIQSPTPGAGQCGTCAVKIESASWGPRSEWEAGKLAKKYGASNEQYHLACQTPVQPGEATITLRPPPPKK